MLACRGALITGPDDTPVYVLDGKTPTALAPPPGTET